MFPANVVGAQVRNYRSKAGLTQKELSDLCQREGLRMPRGTLAKIESQVRFVKACELFIIAKVLKVPLEHFFRAISPASKSKSR
ncbi:MAG: helix-turn-helix transcriptional regulator [Limisphaerales bacterium]